jgi:arsenate reductase
MREIGIDISAHWSKAVDEFMGKEFDYVITVCDHANEVCPVFPGSTRRLHWAFEDPGELEDFRRVRDQIRKKVREFLGS